MNDDAFNEAIRVINEGLDRRDRRIQELEALLQRIGQGYSNYVGEPEMFEDIRRTLNGW